VNLALPALERWDPRRAVAALAVAAIHVVVIAGLVAAIRVPMQIPSREIVLVFPILYVPPAHKRPVPSKEKQRAAPAPPVPVLSLPNFPSNAITLPETHALRGLGDWLACGGDTSKLSPEDQARCARRDLGLAPHKDDGLAFIVKAPPAAMSAADRAERIRDTVDPCMVDKAAHLPFCVNQIIHGDALP
jgi:hypothetical protein